MPKFDPSFLPALPVRRETKTFTLKGGQEITLTAQVTDGGEATYARIDAHRENLETWGAVGVPQPGLPNIKVTNTTCWLITRILLAIVPGPGEDESDLWTFSHWAVLQSRDEASFSAISAWVGELIDPSEDEDDDSGGANLQGDPTPAPPPGSGDGAEVSWPAPLTSQEPTPTS